MAWRFTSDELRQAKPPGIKPQLNVATRGLDYEGMATLRRRGLATIVRGARGNQYWQLTPEGRDAIHRFLTSPSKQDVDESLLLDLARLR